MPIFIGQSTKNQAEIIHNAKPMQKVYVGANLVWQKITVHLGLLYNRAAINDVRELAPLNYRIATLADYQDLITFYGGSTLAGADLKALEAWTAPNSGATANSKFKALPAGQRNEFGVFSGIYTQGLFWIK
jgi:uncharacterized protein (TIGR02145 family)